jgi:hypothetical protein
MVYFVRFYGAWVTSALTGPDPMKSLERTTSPRYRDRDGESIENATISSNEADERLPVGEAEPEKKARRDQYHSLLFADLPLKDRTNRSRLFPRSDNLSETGEIPSSPRGSQLSDALRRWLPLPSSGERAQQSGDSGSKPPEKRAKRRKVTSYIAPTQAKTAFE